MYMHSHTCVYNNTARSKCSLKVFESIRKNLKVAFDTLKDGSKFFIFIVFCFYNYILATEEHEHDMYMICSL